MRDITYKIPLAAKTMYGTFHRSHRDLYHAVHSVSQHISLFDNFACELFSKLYYDPDLRLTDPMAPEAAWLLQLHKEIEGRDDFEALVWRCQGNAVNAGLTTLNLIEQLKEVKAFRDADENRISDPQPMRDAVRELKKKVQPDNQELQKLIEQGKQAVAQNQQLAEHLTNEQASQVVMAIDKAIEQANQEIEEFDAQSEFFGLSAGRDGSELKFGSEEKRLELAKQLANNRVLKRILELAGRLKMEADRKRRTLTASSYGSLAGIETGDNLARLVPSELNKLAIPELNPLFMLGYTEKTLLQYSAKSKEKLQKGPLIFLLDSSSSMADPFGEGTYSRDDLAKAIAFVLATLAAKEKRQFKVVVFNARVKGVIDCEERSEGLIKLLQFLPSGNTSFSAPVLKGLKIIKEQQYKKADIILLTDGEAEVTDYMMSSLEQAKQERELSVYGLMLGNKKYRLENLKLFCDRAFGFADDASALEQLSELFCLT